MKTVLITGASGNLGQAVADKFLKEGYHVTGTVHSKNSLTSGHTEFEKTVVDLGSEEKAGQFVESVFAKHSRIDVAVLTVGGFAAAKIADTRTSDILEQYKLNFETAYNIARPVFLKMMEQGNGRIFLIGSKAGLDSRNSKGLIAYGLGKSLIFRLAELMNDEAKGQNVVTSVVVPSTIDTPQNRKAMPDAKFEKWVKPEQIANVIYYHTTDEASIVRETVIKVYGNA